MPLKPGDDKLLAALWEAYHSEFGVLLKWESSEANTELVLQRLSNLRRTEPELKAISFEWFRSKPHEIYLTKRPKDD